MFARIECSRLRIVPPCPRCRSTDWRSEIDELIAPDYVER
jgi:hypothetical protein